MELFSLHVEVFLSKQRLPLIAKDKLGYLLRGHTIFTIITVTPIAPLRDISTYYLAVKGLFKKALSNSPLLGYYPKKITPERIGVAASNFPRCPKSVSVIAEVKGKLKGSVLGAG